MEAPTHVDEAGDVHVVERRGKVESSRAGLWFGGKGDRRQLLDHERKHNVTAKNDGRVGRGDRQHRNGTEAGILLVSEYVRRVNTTPNPCKRRTPAHVIFLVWLKI